MSENYYAVFGKDGVLSRRLIGGIHQIPKFAISVDDDLWLQLTQETDGVWVIDKDKKITKQPFPVLEPDYPLIERQWRDAEVDRVKWLRERHRDESELKLKTSITDDQYSDLLIYIQELRDWPQSKSFPSESKRPVAPEWITDQAQ